MDSLYTASRAARSARRAFARHIASKADERTAKGSARYERAGRGLKARLREALTLSEVLDLAGEA